MQDNREPAWHAQITFLGGSQHRYRPPLEGNAGKSCMSNQMTPELLRRQIYVNQWSVRSNIVHRYFRNVGVSDVWNGYWSSHSKILETFTEKSLHTILNLGSSELPDWPVLYDTTCRRMVDRFDKRQFVQGDVLKYHRYFNDDIPPPHSAVLNSIGLQPPPDMLSSWKRCSVPRIQNSPQDSILRSSKWRVVPWPCHIKVFSKG